MLELLKIPRSSFYEASSRTDPEKKNEDLVSTITQIVHEHDKTYGYRRITLELARQGIKVNHKKVLRLTKKYNLLALTPRKRKYSSYKGDIGKVADNHIKRDFEAQKPNEKWFTDITEFNLRGKKLYLSPILDAYARDIVAYNVSTSPNLAQIDDMLEKAYSNYPELTGLIFHSDQGWQYQHNSYQTSLKKRGIIQSMSRKGNSPDNGLMESFFGVMKNEMFYGREKRYKNIEELEKGIIDYIEYYNNKRIKVKFKGLTPIECRNQSLNK